MCLHRHNQEPLGTTPWQQRSWNAKLWGTCGAFSILPLLNYSLLVPSKPWNLNPPWSIHIMFKRRYRCWNSSSSQLRTCKPPQHPFSSPLPQSAISAGLTSNWDCDSEKWPLDNAHLRSFWQVWKQQGKMCEGVVGGTLRDALMSEPTYILRVYRLSSSFN